MSDEKKLVIKINYPTKGAEAGEPLLNAQDYLTEWNIKRITSVAIAAGLLFLLAGYFWLNSGSETRPEESTAAHRAVVDKTDKKDLAAEVTAASRQPGQTPSHAEASVSSEPAVPMLQSPKLQGQVVRSVLATAIRNKEPDGIISSLLKINKNTKRTIYYFTEITGMSGQQIYHEWLYEGKSLFKRPIKITDQRWRTATHKTISDTEEGDWSVRLLDNSGNILKKADFKVVHSN